MSEFGKPSDDVESSRRGRIWWFVCLALLAVTPLCLPATASASQSATCVAHVGAMYADRKLTPAAPLTLSITLSPSSFLRHTACARQGRLSLSITGARLLAGNTGGILVFLNKSDATAATPPSDPHFAGSFDFFPADSSDHSFDVDLSAAFARTAVTHAERIFVTLVALPHPSANATPAHIAIGALRLEDKAHKR